ncbi:MAG: TIGR02594 family protein [Chitinophagaceae bacterium]
MKQILDHLKTITPPRMVREALALYGVTEAPGTKNNAVIVNWAKETNIKGDNWYSDDSIPWCGLFVAVVAQRANWQPPNEALRALAWADFGNKSPQPSLGDVLVFKRKGGGHVGLYVGETADSFYVLGGNQSDKVNITRIAKARLFDCRRPPYKIPPESVKPYHYTSSGELSQNEA